MIAHASIDENGKTVGLNPGDNTKKEVCTCSFYKAPWNYVIRCKNNNMRERIAVAMELAAANDNIGYSQPRRNSLLDKCRLLGYNPGSVKVLCDCDCSSLVSVACMYAGIPEKDLFKNNNCPTTANIRSRLMATGKFETLTNSKYTNSDEYLLRGDILLREPGHVACNITNGKKVTATKTPKSVTLGIDVSRYQKKINWEKVKASGVKFAIIKAIGKDIDSCFEYNYKECKDVGIELKGIYHYSYATNESQAAVEADNMIKLINGRNVGIVYLDVEDDCQKNIGKTLINIILVYKKIIESNGYEFGLYSGDSFINSYLKPYVNDLKDIKHTWVARYGVNNGKINAGYEPVNKCDIWQYTSVGSVDGIDGNVDMNIIMNSYSPISAPTITPTPTISKEIPILVMGRVNIKSGTLNIRKEPNSTSLIIKQLNKCAYVQLKGDLGTWYRTDDGYVSKDYIEQVHGVVTANKLNMRTSADSTINTNIVKVLLKDEEVIICTATSEWYYVLTTDGTLGWVKGQYINLK